MVEDLAAGPAHEGDYRFAGQRVLDRPNGQPGQECWFIVRRDRKGGDPRYYLSNPPPGTPLSLVADLADRCRAMEALLPTARVEAGLDEYEVRGWKGWHHHVALSLMAGAFLLARKQGHAPEPGLTGAIDRVSRQDP